MVSNSLMVAARSRVSARKTARLISATSAFSTASTRVSWVLAAWSWSSLAVSSLPNGAILLKFISRSCVISCARSSSGAAAAKRRSERSATCVSTGRACFHCCRSMESFGTFSSIVLQYFASSGTPVTLASCGIFSANAKQKATSSTYDTQAASFFVPSHPITPAMCLSSRLKPSLATIFAFTVARSIGPRSRTRVAHAPSERTAKTAACTRDMAPSSAGRSYVEASPACARALRSSRKWMSRAEMP
mmetsp:Transcript_85000/g.240726  ORF Transcript_85000/g.240726 Transcript_85000/m.240726 type:complete len:247 (+) Transcript_85000:41-781(+)